MKISQFSDTNSNLIGHLKYICEIVMLFNKNWHIFYKISFEPII